MAQIIIDMGSGNTSKNNKAYIKRMYDELKAIDTGKHNVTVKWQLFEKAGDNIPLLPEIFDYAYNYGTSLGYPVTASVFDKPSLDFLLEYNVPMIKIANNRNLDWLIGEIPRKMPVYVSFGNYKEYEAYKNSNTVKLACISKYPADLKDYEHNFIYGSEYGRQFIQDNAISDHTATLDLWNTYMPQIIEWHYVLEHDKNNLDGGLFARTPSMLQEVL